jgi:hypothetical protein
MTTFASAFGSSDQNENGSNNHTQELNNFSNIDLDQQPTSPQPHLNIHLMLV